MCTNVTRWGNSLAIRLPKNIAAELQLKEDSTVDLTIEGGRIVLTPTRPKYDLAELVAGIQPNTLHSETDWGEPVGKERI